ncbi:alpha/beta hydrolase [Microbacterium pumilum]|uniref:alpha/beta hydrolase n=1 Tax=Microbacterium pumilum TaxID=344165 RepID=UPI0031CFB963
MSSGNQPVPAPPFDPEIAAAFAMQLQQTSPITLADIPSKRAEDDAAAADAVERITQLGLIREDHQVRSYDGEAIGLSIVHRPERTLTSPLIYYIHGGGMMMGNRWSGFDVYLDWINRYNAVIATVDYRLAPEAVFPTPQEDCYAAYEYLANNSDLLKLNLSNGLIAGISAGGGLAAAVTLMARDRGGPTFGGQLLLAPMLDDRGTSPSTRQFSTGLWNAAENDLGWRSVLGSLYGTDEVPEYAAPARASDLGRLPPAFLEVGSAEVFRDEVVEFASGIWKDGGQADLHVWSGGFHGFVTFEHTVIAQGAANSLLNWMDRTLGFTGRP